MFVYGKLNSMRRILLILMCVLVVGVVGAETGFLGYFKQTEDLNLSQSCDGCTFNNITKVLYPNGTTAIYNVTMISDGSGTYYYYTLSSNYTKTIGVYSVYGMGDDSSGANWNYDFAINTMGVELTTSRSMIYIILFVILIFLFVINLIAISKLPNSNPRGDQNEILSISWMKYLKSILFVCAWGIIVAMLLISSSLTNSYLGEAGISSLLLNSFKVLTSWQLITAGFSLWFFLLIWNVVRDIRIKGILDRGFFPTGENYG